MSDSTYDKILAAARNRFATDGYRDVTIRSIAEESGYSPAMVIKVMGSKERLFWLGAPDLTSTTGLEDVREVVPKTEIGKELVRRIFARRSMGADDPYAIAPLLVRSAPEPEQIGTEIRTRYLHNIAAFIGDDTPDRQHARNVLTQLLGIAAAVHSLNVFEDMDDEAAMAPLVAQLQGVIDRCTGPRMPLPDESVGISAATHEIQERGITR